MNEYELKYNKNKQEIFDQYRLLLEPILNQYNEAYKTEFDLAHLSKNFLCATNKEELTLYFMPAAFKHKNHGKLNKALKEQGIQIFYCQSYNMDWRKTVPFAGITIKYDIIPAHKPYELMELKKRQLWDIEQNMNKTHYLFYAEFEDLITQAFDVYQKHCIENNHKIELPNIDFYRHVDHVITKGKQVELYFECTQPAPNRMLSSMNSELDGVRISHRRSTDIPYGRHWSTGNCSICITIDSPEVVKCDWYKIHEQCKNEIHILTNLMTIIAGDDSDLVLGVISRYMQKEYDEFIQDIQIEYADEIESGDFEIEEYFGPYYEIKESKFFYNREGRPCVIFEYDIECAYSLGYSEESIKLATKELKETGFKNYGDKSIMWSDMGYEGEYARICMRIYCD